MQLFVCQLQLRQQQRIYIQVDHEGEEEKLNNQDNNVKRHSAILSKLCRVERDNGEDLLSD